jgi:hypothetical protein
MGRIFRRLSVLLVALLTWSTAGPAAQSQPSLFVFTTNDFWLNLHHYLYVLGRAHSHMPDATQPAVASAPDDERQGLRTLNDEEHRNWDASVTAYANS